MEIANRENVKENDINFIKQEFSKHETFSEHDISISGEPGCYDVLLTHDYKNEYKFNVSIINKEVRVNTSYISYNFSIKPWLTDF